MKRSSFEEREDPSIAPADGSSPIEMLPPDVVYKLFVESGKSVKELARFCRVNQQFRNVCADEYIWRKLYFLKVVKTPGLAQMPEPQARRYVQRVLMKTPEGVQWTAQAAFASNLFELLIAFVYRNAILYDYVDETATQRRFTRVRLSWGNEKQEGGFFTMIPEIEGIFVVDQHYYLNQRGQLLGILKGLGWKSEIILSPNEEDQEDLPDPNEATYIRHDRIIAFFCRLLQEDWIPSIEKNREDIVAPSLLESCLSCGSPAPLVQCGAACGQARYCDQGCANAHWKEHQKDCCSNQSL